MTLSKKHVGNVMVPLAVTSFIFLDGCKKDEITPKFSTDLLIGNWQFTEYNGYTLDSTSAYLLFMKFDLSGDLDICTGYPSYPQYNYCYTEKWRWVDANQAAIIISEGGDDISKMNILILDDTRLEGNFIYLGYPEQSSFKAVRVD